MADFSNPIGGPQGSPVTPRATQTASSAVPVLTGLTALAEIGGAVYGQYQAGKKQEAYNTEVKQLDNQMSAILTAQKTSRKSDLWAQTEMSKLRDNWVNKETSMLDINDVDDHFNKLKKGRGADVYVSNTQYDKDLNTVIGLGMVNELSTEDDKTKQVDLYRQMLGNDERLKREETKLNRDAAAARVGTAEFDLAQKKLKLNQRTKIYADGNKFNLNFQNMSNNMVTRAQTMGSDELKASSVQYTQLWGDQMRQIQVQARDAFATGAITQADLTEIVSTSKFTYDNTLKFLQGKTTLEQLQTQNSILEQQSLNHAYQTPGVLTNKVLTQVVGNQAFAQLMTSKDLGIVDMIGALTNSDEAITPVNIGKAYVSKTAPKSNYVPTPDIDLDFKSQKFIGELVKTNQSYNNLTAEQQKGQIQINESVMSNYVDEQNKVPSEYKASIISFRSANIAKMVNTMNPDIVNGFKEQFDDNYTKPLISKVSDYLETNNLTTIFSFGKVNFVNEDGERVQNADLSTALTDVIKVQAHLDGSTTYNDYFDSLLNTDNNEEKPEIAGSRRSRRLKDKQ